MRLRDSGSRRVRLAGWKMDNSCELQHCNSGEKPGNWAREPEISPAILPEPSPCPVSQALDNERRRAHNSKAPPAAVPPSSPGFLARITLLYFALVIRRHSYPCLNWCIPVALTLTVGFCSPQLAHPSDPTWQYRDRPLSAGVAAEGVSQLNLASTVCKPGWTATIRPNTSYTNKLKRSLVTLESDRNPSHYELDHIISLQLGGDPVAPGNLWLQHYAEPCGARRKDVLEGKLKRLVCSGSLTLIEAQALISTDWVAAYNSHLGRLVCRGD